VTMRPIVEPFFDKASSTIAYLVHGGEGSAAAVIDPVKDGEAPVAASIERQRLRLDWILETHIHADHITGAPALKARVGGKHAIGTGARAAFGIEPGGWDRLFADGETFAIGDIAAEVIAAPGHTPEGVAYRIGDALFVGDTLFMPDGGSARCDFPGGDAGQLYRSVRRLLALPPVTRLFVCHDYGPGGRPIAWETTVGAQRQCNIHLRDGIDEAAFVALRTARDATLSPPALLEPSVRANLRAGAS